MKILITCLLLVCTSNIWSQKKTILKFVKEITVPADPIPVNLRNFWMDTSDIECSKYSQLMDVINDCTKEDSIYWYKEPQTYYVYKNLVESDLDLMKALGEEKGIYLSTPEGVTEVRHRLALMAWLTRDYPDSSVIQHPGRLFLIVFGYVRLSNDLIVYPKLVSDKDYPIWFIDASEPSGHKRVNDHTWFISRKKPTKQELKDQLK